MFGNTLLETLRRMIAALWPHTRHHLLVALVVASVAVVLKYWGLLGVLEVASLRVVMQAQLAPPPAPANDVPAWHPVVLLITDEMYETQLGEASPLNREKLAEWLHKITLGAPAPPATLVIDLDLSPGPEAATHRPGQQRLDALLAQIAAQGSTRLILMVPFPVATSALAEVKFNWMAALCEEGKKKPALPGGRPRLEFAHAEAPVTAGLALRYARGWYSLGVAAADHDASIERPCDVVAKGREKTLFLRRQSAPSPASVVGLMPINVRGLALPEAALVALDNPPTGLTGRTVFVGAAYGQRDVVATPFGLRNGVEVHAATYFSVREPVRPLSEWIGFPLEVALGLALGFLFAWSWGVYEKAARASATGLLAYTRARGWLLLNLALAAAVCYGALVVSARLFPHNVWIDPAPIVVGVFVKALLASRTTAAPDLHHARQRPHTVGRAIDWATFAVVVGYALFIVITHQH